ncbi:MAG: cupin domain-containing protein [Candidatus Bathyarchaeia archaeon]
MEIIKAESLMDFSVDKYRRMPLPNTKGLMRLLCFGPNQNVPFHRHPEADEIFYVLKGQGEISVGAEKMKVKNGFFVKAPAGVLHQWKNGKERLVLISVLIPPSSYVYVAKILQTMFVE